MQNALVLYKNRPAVVTGAEDGKIVISLPGESPLKVREKDVELLHPGPCTLAALAEETPPGDVRSAWELLEGGDGGLSLRELAELVFEAFTPRTALAAWRTLRENVYFSGEINSIRARPRAELEAAEKKRREKQMEAEERGAFLEKLRNLAAGSAGTVLTEAERRFLQDVEALARGQTDKSRTLKELGKSESPADAHRFLLACGVWTMWENPHPGRFGLSLNRAVAVPPSPPEEDRLDLTGLPAYAIDNAWSDDPDDAVSLEGPDPAGRLSLWVHVADPAASVTSGSSADIEAKNRGATLYLPEGVFRMLAPECLPLFILGRTDDEKPLSALSFKIVLNPDCTIAETGVFLSRVKVTRLTYDEADALIDTDKILGALYRLAEQNIERRLDTGAVIIEMPETHISVHLGPAEKTVSIEPVLPRRSADMVRECMILAGEGAARWAVRNRVPFPFVSQEEGELGARRLPGLAGAWLLRRGMRPRVLSAKPGVHWGLGLDMYTQVTSPLRRYTDLLAHQQIRAFLKGQKLLDEDEVLLRAAAAEASAAAAAKAERASRGHWTAVYLADKIGSVWEGVILDIKGSRAVTSIPALGIETQVSARKGAPNEKISLACLSVSVPEGEAGFAEQ